MKKALRVIAWIALTTLIFAAPVIQEHLPSPPDNVVQRSYASWSGVLRVWVCEGFAAGNGSMTGWLLSCAARFEKRHPGVYVQLNAVSQETLAAFAQGEVPAPDLLLYAPGMLDSAENLMALSDRGSVRPELLAACAWQGELYAIPIAMGGYGWLLNRAMLTEAPLNWSELERPAPEGGRGRQKAIERYLMQVPADAEHMSWSGALIALLSNLPEQANEQAEPLAGEGLDLGLLPARTPLPEVTLLPERQNLLFSPLPTVLPDGFRQISSAFNAFANGQVAAIPATQREVRRLALLAESGRAPDYSMKMTGIPFTDQLALLSVVAQPRKDGEARQGLSAQLIEHLLSEESQQALTKARLFPVREGLTLYAGESGMAQMEAALSGREILLPPAFGGSWRKEASRLADRLQSGDISTREAMELLKSVLAN